MTLGSLGLVPTASSCVTALSKARWAAIARAGLWHIALILHGVPETP